MARVRRYAPDPALAEPREVRGADLVRRGAPNADSAATVFATAAPGARRTTSRSLRPGFLIPAMATPSSTPATG